MKIAVTAIVVMLLTSGCDNVSPGKRCLTIGEVHKNSDGTSYTCIKNRDGKGFWVDSEKV